MAKRNTLEEIIVPVDRYQEFEQAYYFVQALLEAGVDNWEGWDDVKKKFYKVKE